MVTRTLILGSSELRIHFFFFEDSFFTLFQQIFIDHLIQARQVTVLGIQNLVVSKKEVIFAIS